MLRWFCTATAMLFCVGALVAEEYEAKIKKIDTDKGTAIVTINGTDKTFTISKDPLIVTDKGKNVPGGLKALTPMSEVIVFTDKKDDKEVITTFKVSKLAKKTK
jgi:hypothetical protein